MINFDRAAERLIAAAAQQVIAMGTVDTSIEQRLGALGYDLSALEDDVNAYLKEHA